MSQRTMTCAELDIFKSILPIINCLESVTKAQKVRKEDDIVKEEFDTYLKMKNNLKEDDILKEEFDTYLKMKNNLKEDEEKNKILELNEHMKNNFKIVEYDGIPFKLVEPLNY